MQIELSDLIKKDNAQEERINQILNDSEQSIKTGVETIKKAAETDIPYAAVEKDTGDMVIVGDVNKVLNRQFYFDLVDAKYELEVTLIKKHVEHLSKEDILKLAKKGTLSETAVSYSFVYEAKLEKVTPVYRQHLKSVLSDFGSTYVLKPTRNQDGEYVYTPRTDQELSNVLNNVITDVEYSASIVNIVSNLFELPKEFILSSPCNAIIVMFEVIGNNPDVFSETIVGLD